MRFIGIVILVAIVVWIVSMAYNKKQIFNAKGDSNSKVADSETNNLYIQDSDEDGIYDWEEGLWGTDPNKEDSDADGVSDGEEIAIRKKEVQAENNLSEEDPGSESSNQTEIFARQLLSTASLAEQQGGLSAESMEDFSKAFGDSIASSTIPDRFTLADLKLSSVSNAAYKAELAKAFDEYRKANISELGSIYRLANDDASASGDLERIAQLYAKLSDNLLKIQTPHAIAGTHLVLANNSLKLSIIFESMKALAEDPLSAVAGFKQYQKYSLEMESAIIRLTAYFSSVGV